MTTPQPPFVRIPPEFLSLFAGIYIVYVFIKKKKIRIPPSTPTTIHKDSSRDAERKTI
jgi:hypothetical protein